MKLFLMKYNDVTKGILVSYDLMNSKMIKHTIKKDNLLRKDVENISIERIKSIC